MLTVLLQPNPVSGDFSANARHLAELARHAMQGNHPVTGMTPRFKPLCLTSAFALAGHGWEAMARVDGFYERSSAAAQALALMLNGMPDGGPDMLLSMPCAETPLYMLLSQGAARPVSLGKDRILRLPGVSLFVPEDTLLYSLAGTAATFPVAAPSQPVDAVLFSEAFAFCAGAQSLREAHYSALAKNWNLPVFALNQYGATDGALYAGQSCVFTPVGTLAARAAAFAQGSLVVDLPRQGSTAELKIDAPTPIAPDPIRLESLFQACVLGVRDYVHKCGFSGVVLGLSGGMDSALVAAIAVQALGPDNVLAVMMPSPWSSAHSVDDAKLLAKRLGVEAKLAPISAMMDSFDATLDPLFADHAKRPGDLTAENLQARIRGVVLMAFSNRLNRIVLATSNKSEAAVGYCTLYGDTVGAIEPIGDIYKTEVYEVARWYNAMRGEEIIPEHIFTKAPSAELRPGQADSDNLPPYEVLDAILRELLEGGANPETLSLPGITPETIRQVVRLLAVSEFKRHQCPPSFQLSPCTLGADWRMPVAAKALPVF